MRQFLTLFDGYFVIYDTLRKQVKLYTDRQLNNLLNTGVKIDGLTVTPNGMKEVVLINNDLGDIAFTTKTEKATFILRTKITLPKLPCRVSIYYKGLIVRIQETFAPATYDYQNIHHMYNKRGKCFDIDYHGRQVGLAKHTDISFIEYMQLVQEFLSCLTFDNQVIEYRIHLFCNTSVFDLTEAKKTFRISKYKVTPKYILHIADTEVKQLKIADLNFADTVTVNVQAIRTVNLIDCTCYTVQDLHNTDKMNVLLHIINEHLVNCGVIIFKNVTQESIEYFTSINKYSSILTAHIVNIGNFRGKKSMDSVIKQIRTQQGKYALLSENKRLVLVANVVER